MGAAFGWSVGAAGDVNGDGYGDVIVGAPFWTNPQEDEGGAFVYCGGPDQIDSAPCWSKAADKADAYFGWSVAGAGDVNADGYADIIVGAPLNENDVDDDDEGMAYVYIGSPTGVKSAPYFSKDSDQSGANFGSSVASAGDVNRDGFSDVIVGAPYYDSTFTNGGGAWVYIGSPDGMVASPDWFDYGHSNGARYGHSVGTAGDVNGDGFSDVIVGSPYYSSGSYDFQGAVYVYHGSAGGLLDDPAWDKYSGQSETHYGISVGTAGDVNGDGFADIVLGSPGMDVEGVTRAGAARVVLGSASGLAETDIAWRGTGPEALSGYGTSVATAGDVNGDGYDEIIVGAPFFGSAVENPPNNEGKVWVYHGGGGKGLALNPRQVDIDETPLSHLGVAAYNGIYVWMMGKSPFMTGRMALASELNGLHAKLDGSGYKLDGSMSLKSFGADHENIWLLHYGKVYHWRARLRFDPTSQPYLPATRWLSLPYHGLQEADFRTPGVMIYLPVVQKN